MPAFAEQFEPQQIADLSQYLVVVDERLNLLFRDGFPRDVAAFACDLDGTLVGPRRACSGRGSGPRSRARRTPASPSSSRPAGCSARSSGTSRRPGSRSRSSATRAPPWSTHGRGEFLLHEPLELDVAREAIAALEELGLSPNVYVDDELFVARETEYSRAYSGFQRLPVTEVGDLLAWLDRPPTKLVAVAEPDVLAEARAELVAPLRRAASSSRRPCRTSSSSATRPSRRARGSRSSPPSSGSTSREVVAFGDGENDVELLEVAGFGIAIEGAHPRLLEIADATCPGPERDGVAAVIDAFLDSVA